MPRFSQGNNIGLMSPRSILDESIEKYRHPIIPSIMFDQNIQKLNMKIYNELKDAQINCHNLQKRLLYDRRSLG